MGRNIVSFLSHFLLHVLFAGHAAVKRNGLLATVMAFQIPANLNGALIPDARRNSADDPLHEENAVFLVLRQQATSKRKSRPRIVWQRLMDSHQEVFGSGGTVEIPNIHREFDLLLNVERPGFLTLPQFRQPSTSSIKFMECLFPNEERAAGPLFR